MLIRIVTAVVAASVVAGCSSGPGDGYTVAHRAQGNGSGSADLVMPDAGQGQAREALRDYAGTISGVELYYLKVVRSEGADRYVCRARWYRHAASYAAHSDHAAQPDVWPHLDITCP
ncbi:hypothetical protein OIA45_48995 (plasmid) [Streptomyces chartreusis]|uniref:hypothetical protein n=1 Tax=Streptomyces chartreusis TaxID=1969 RepID=UPI0037DCEFAB|nr:hypothetical protein OIA45_48995 [Streptomyces chartreusis]